MSDMNDKELLEQLNIIKKDAECIEISEKVKPENMMRRLEMMEKEMEDKKSYFDGNKVSGDIGKKSKGSLKDRFINGWKHNKLFRGGMVATVVVFVLIVVTTIIGNNKKLYAADDYYKNVKADTESEKDVAILSSYENLHKYFIVEETTEINYSFFEVLSEFFDSMFINFGAYSSDDGGIAGPEGDAGNYSQTNTRTENIDEADVAKTDGEYIYYFEKRSNTKGVVQLVIARAAGEETNIISRIPLAELLYEVEKVEGTSGDFVMESHMEIMLYGDKLVVLADYLEKTVALIFDITDRTAPLHMDTLYVDGNYQSSKMIDGYLYIFSNMDLSRKMDLYIDENKEALSEEEAKKLLAINSSNGVLDSGAVYVSECEDYDDYEVMSTIDMNDTSKFKQIKAILGSNQYGNMYMSGEHIYYISEAHVDLKDFADIEKAEDEEEIIVTNKTEIISLTYKEGTIEPKSRAFIDGRVNDEFDIDEYNGYLRIAVSVSSYMQECTKGEREFYNGQDWCVEEFWRNEGYVDYISEGSALYVLDENLQVVGSIPKLKNDESVHGVRFDGDIGYVVTYRQMDPLFTIDLSDPTNPKVLGALKIPGFSEYLHKWDENTLVGIGYSDSGDIKISTFDITDKTRVTEKDVCEIYKYYDAEALYNHRAVLISSEKNIIGFSGNWGECYSVYSYVDGRLEEVIAHEFKYSMYEGAEYANVRGLYVDDYIYIICENEGIYVYDLNTYDLVTYKK